MSILPISEVRDLIRSYLRDLLPGTVTCLRYPPGTAKTSIAFEVVIECARQGRKIVFLGKTYRLLYETPLQAVLEAEIPFKLLLTMTAKDVEGRRYCRHGNDAQRLTEAGLDAHRILCNSCEKGLNRKNCPAYRGELGCVNAMAMLGVHQSLPQAVREAGPETIIIIDEAIGVYQETRIALESFPTAIAVARMDVVDDVARNSILAALTRIRRWAGTETPGVPRRMDEILGPVFSLGLAQIDLRTLSLDTSSGSRFIDRAVRLGRVLKPILEAAHDPDTLLEVEVDSQTGARRLLVHGRDRRVTGTLDEAANPIVLLDGTLDEPLIRAALRNKEIVIRKATVADACHVDRVIFQASNSTKTRLTQHTEAGPPVRWDFIVGPTRVVFAFISEYDQFSDPDHVKLLLVSFKFVIDPIREWFDPVNPVIPEDPQALQVYEIIRSWMDRGHTISFENYWNSLGTNDYADYDCCVTLGDPRINMGTARRRARFTHEDFDTMYKRMPREELYQVYGRLRVIVPERRKPALLIRVGRVAPIGWYLNNTDVLLNNTERRRLRLGRPRVEVVIGRELPTRAEREANGLSRRQVAEEFGVSISTVRRREREPVD